MAQPWQASGNLNNSAVLTAGEDRVGRIYELAGDEPYTLSQLAAEISRQSRKPIAYKNLSEADYKAALPGEGLPEGLAALLADSDTGLRKAHCSMIAASSAASSDGQPHRWLLPSQPHSGADC